MCTADTPALPPPAPKAPPVLEQIAPKSAKDTSKDLKRKKTGLSRYKVDSSSVTPGASGLGAIPKKTQTGV